MSQRDSGQQFSVTRSGVNFASPILPLDQFYHTLDCAQQLRGVAQCDMNDCTANDTSSSAFQIYPKRYFDLSGTWFEWNRLTAADIHALRDEHGFEGQQIAFYLNHPIRFVRVVGLVVDIELTRGARYALIALDDGSGACIEIKVVLRDDPAGDSAQFPSNTTVDCVDVHVHLGSARVAVNKEFIDIGTVLKVKARLDSFRNSRQLLPERVWIVHDTNEEVRSWAEVAAWKREKLSLPWGLTSAQRAQVDDSIRLKALQERKRAQKAQELRAKYAQKKQRQDEKTEAKRKREEKRMNEGALTGSHLIAEPWD